MPRPAKRAPEKRCEMCSKRLSRRRFGGGRLEDLTAFIQRRFCSLSCANSQLKGGTSRNAYLRQARKLLKPACECCGATKKRHAHHVNEGWADNRSENVQTLCVFCHQFWHSMHRRLGVPCTQPMPRLLPLSPTGYPPEWENCAPPAMRSSRKSGRNS